MHLSYHPLGLATFSQSNDIAWLLINSMVLIGKPPLSAIKQKRGQKTSVFEINEASSINPCFIPSPSLVIIKQATLVSSKPTLHFDLKSSHVFHFRMIV